MGNWQEGPQGQTPVTVKLARIALRAQRLLLLRRIEQVQVLVKSHTPDLCQTPGGTAALEKVEAQLRAARRHLQEAPLG